MSMHKTHEELNEEKETLLKEIEKEKLKHQSLQNEFTAITFRNLQNQAKNLITMKEFSMKNVRDAAYYMGDDFITYQEEQVKKCQQIIDATVRVTGVNVISINKIIENQLPQYILRCKFQDNCNMEITLATPTLDNPEVQLMNVLIDNQDLNVKEFITMCCRINSVPVLVQGIGKYFHMKEQRHELIQKLHQNYDKKMLICKQSSGDDSDIVLQFVNPTTGKKLIKFLWVIAYDSHILSFSNAFKLSSDMDGLWLRKNHSQLLHTIVNSKNMSTAIEENWIQLCTLVTNRTE